MWDISRLVIRFVIGICLIPILYLTCTNRDKVPPSVESATMITVFFLLNFDFTFIASTQIWYLEQGPSGSFVTNLVTILVTNDKVVGGIRYSGGLLGWGQFGAPMVAYNWEGYPGCNWEVKPPMVACNWEGRTQAFSWDQLCCMVDLLCHSYSI